MSKWSSGHNKTKVFEKKFDKLNFGRTNVSVRNIWRSQSHSEADKDSQRNMNLKKKKYELVAEGRNQCVFVNKTGRRNQL